MDGNLTKEQKERLRELIENVLEDDVLTLEDEAEILQICIEAAKKRKAEAAEEYLRYRLGGEEETE